MTARSKPKKKTLRNQCDQLASKIVRARGQCEACDSTRSLQWAHGHSRRYLAIRWDLRNGFCLCASCHWYFTNRPIEWDAWRAERWGPVLDAELRDLALHGSVPDLLELRDQLRAQLALVNL